MSYLKNLLTKVSSSLLDFLYPPVCLLCKKPGLHPLCGDCLTLLEPHPTTFSLRLFNALTILPYENTVRDIIHKIKFDSCEKLCDILSDLTYSYLVNLPKHTLVPVPIHPLRIRKRGFNQAAVIAKRLSKMLGWDYAPRLIWKTRNTRPQFELELHERAENVKDAFAPHPLAKLDPIKSYMLVDDIITTGSTLQSCAGVLQRMGASVITALAVARAGDAKTLIVDSSFFL